MIYILPIITFVWYISL